MSDDLDWDDLRYFLRAIQAGTLSGAARGLGVEHSTIGRRLTRLEQSLGAALVVRGPDGLKLTRLGTKLLPLVETVERAVAVVRNVAEAERACVRLSVPSGFTKMFTAGIPELRREHPSLSLAIVSGARAVDLKQGEADLALRTGPVTEEDLVTRKLCTVGWSLYASKAYLARRPEPIDPDDLSGHELIGFDRALAGVPAAKWLDERAHDATFVLRSREMTDVLAATVAGIGIAVLPCILGDDEAELMRLTPAVIAKNNVSLVYRREARASEQVRAVARFVARLVGEQAERISGARGHG